MDPARLLLLSQVAPDREEDRKQDAARGEPGESIRSPAPSLVCVFASFNASTGSFSAFSAFLAALAHLPAGLHQALHCHSVELQPVDVVGSAALRANRLPVEAAGFSEGSTTGARSCTNGA